MHSNLVDVPAALVVHLLGAVKHVDHHTERPPKVLGGLCLACSRRTSWSAPHHQVETLGQSDVASVGQRRDHQARGVAKVLVPVAELCVTDVSKAILEKSCFSICWSEG